MDKLTKHHMAYEGKHWRSNRFLSSIRNHHGMIIPLPMVEIHRPLHIAHRRDVPRPSLDAAKYFLEEIVLPYEPNQPLFRTVDQAIGWFAMTGNEPTAEHLASQREFILNRLEERDVA